MKNVETRENFKINYIKSILRVLEENEGTCEEDKTNLNKCVGSLFQEIKMDGDMTRELARELDLEFLLPEYF